MPTRICFFIIMTVCLTFAKSSFVKKKKKSVSLQEYHDILKHGMMNPDFERLEIKQIAAAGQSVYHFDLVPPVPAAINYGPVSPGKSLTKTFNFDNNCADKLVIRSCALMSDLGVWPDHGFDMTTGLFNPTISPSLTDTLDPGQTYQAQVKLAPASISPLHDGLFIIYDQMNSPSSYILILHLTSYEITLDFTASPTSGYPKLPVQFDAIMQGYQTAVNFYGSHNVSLRWDFGNGETSGLTSPFYTYTRPGDYTVSLTVQKPDGNAKVVKHKFIHVRGHQPLSNRELRLVDNSSAFYAQTWENAIDNDVSGWDGTVTAKGDPPYAVFEFRDNSTQRVTGVDLLTDTNVGWARRWVHDFRVFVSTTGLSDTDFTEVLDAHQNTGGWKSHSITPVDAKYIKLVLDTPSSGWRQLGEFRVNVDGPVLSADLSSLSATSPHAGDGVDTSTVTAVVRDTDGHAVSGISADEFQTVYWDNAGHVLDTPFSETLTAGVYEKKVACMTACELKPSVYVRGVHVGQTLIEFSQSQRKPQAVSVVEGSETFKDQTWEKSIDGDTDGWDGVTTTRGSKVYCIYGFTDGLLHAVEGLRLKTDANTPKRYPNRYVKRFQVWVSMTGLGSGDFTRVYDGVQDTWEWKTHLFPTVNGRYVKFVVEYPDHGWVQVAEVEILGKDAGGSPRLTEVEESLLPQAFHVYDNAPNPFNPSTRIRYDVPEPMDVTVEVYNALGQKVRTLYDGMASAGQHTLSWQGRDDAGRAVSSGVFLLRVHAGSEQIVKRMLLIQ